MGRLTELQTCSCTGLQQTSLHHHTHAHAQQGIRRALQLRKLELLALTPFDRSTGGVLLSTLHSWVAHVHVQFAIYPLELIRTRLAVCPADTYAGLSAAAASIWRTEGPLAFYRGLLPSLVSSLWAAGQHLILCVNMSSRQEGCYAMCRGTGFHRLQSIMRRPAFHAWLCKRSLGLLLHGKAVPAW